jgi:DNA-binding transcriptional ArsR family regulator
MARRWPDVDEEYHISDTRQLKAVSNPERMRMLECLIAGPCTATQLGALLNMAPSRAHYHLKQLEAAGLCRMVEQREHGGIVEKYYRAVAARFRLDRTLVASGDAPSAAPEVQALVDSALRGYLHRLQEREAGAAGADELVLQEQVFRLSPQRYARLLARLHALLLEFDSEIPTDRPGQRPYRLLLLAYPDDGPPAPPP